MTDCIPKALNTFISAATALRACDTKITAATAMAAIRKEFFMRASPVNQNYSVVLILSHIWAERLRLWVNRVDFAVPPVGPLTPNRWCNRPAFLWMAED